MPDILTKNAGGILEITLNRPEHGNGATDEMAAELTRIIGGAGEDVRCVVLRGAGNDFCIGRAMMGARPPQGPVEAYERKQAFDVIFQAYGAIRNSRVPVIGVVQGRALGFGCAIAAVCDITLASDKAQFQVPEMAHNILPTMVMSSFIDRVPRKAFTYLVYSTAVISAERALSFGIVSDVVPAAGLDDAVKIADGRHPQGAGAGDPRRQGICPHRLLDVDRRRHRLRAQHPRGDQFRLGDAAVGSINPLRPLAGERVRAQRAGEVGGKCGRVVQLDAHLTLPSLRDGPLPLPALAREERDLIHDGAERRRFGVGGLGESGQLGVGLRAPHADGILVEGELARPVGGFLVRQDVLHAAGIFVAEPVRPAEIEHHRGRERVPAGAEQDLDALVLQEIPGLHHVVDVLDLVIDVLHAGALRREERDRMMRRGDAQQRARRRSSR